MGAEGKQEWWGQYVSERESRGKLDDAKDNVCTCKNPTSHLSHVTWASKLGSPVATATDSPLQKMGMPPCPTSTLSLYPQNPSELRNIHLEETPPHITELLLGEIAISPPPILLPKLGKPIPTTMLVNKEIVNWRM